MQNLTPGKNAPETVNVVIEIPANGSPVKYEVDKDTGLLHVDRFLNTAMYYPCNYGYIPQTLAGDGDPVDVLVVTPAPLLSGSVIEVRPVGMLEMTDESGDDNKLIAVPYSKLTSVYDDVKTAEDLPAGLLATVKHFFEHYKDLEPNKWVKVNGWTGPEAAIKEITDGIANYK